MRPVGAIMVRAMLTEPNKTKEGSISAMLLLS